MVEVVSSFLHDVYIKFAKIPLLKTNKNKPLRLTEKRIKRLIGPLK